MATTLYITGDETDDFSTLDSAKLNGVVTSWRTGLLSTSRGSGVFSRTTSTLNGPTNGIEVQQANGPHEWVSPPLAAAATISGSITWNLRAYESSMSANVAINGILEVIRADGTIVLIDQTARTTELGTAESANNFAETPASGVTCNKGDRLRVRVYGDDAGTMATGFTFVFFYNGSTAAASGDSYLTLTENLTFMDTVSTPGGTKVYMTTTASAVSTADVDLEAWTTAGGSAVTKATNSQNGPVSPITATDGAGGTAMSWFTKPLQATTLSGVAEAFIRAYESGTSVNAAVGVEIARVDGDGTNPTVWARAIISRGASVGTELGTTEATQQGYLAGDDLAISNGQRLRIRLFFDDGGLEAPMATGGTMTVAVNGTSTGGTSVHFATTLAEYSAGESHSGSTSATGGGVAVVSGVKRALRTITGTGGGTAVSTWKGTHTGTAIGTGGGIATIARASARFRAVLATGGGVATLASGKLVQSGAIAATGAGVAVVSGIKRAIRTIAGTGGGVAVTTSKGSHAGTVTGTGGGIAVIARTSARVRAIVATGGGVAVVSTIKRALRTITGTGAGVATLAGQKQARTIVVVTGGGVAVITYAVSGGGVNKTGTVVATGAGIATITWIGRHQGAVVATGGGTGILARISRRFRAVTATGGGTATLAVSAPRRAVIVATGAGVAVITRIAGRRATIAATGAGTALITRIAGRRGAVIATGAGTSAVTARSVRTVVLSASGAGAAALAWIGRHLGELVASGGGSVTITASTLQATPAQALAQAMVLAHGSEAAAIQWLLQSAVGLSGPQAQTAGLRRVPPRQRRARAKLYTQAIQVLGGQDDPTAQLLMKNLGVRPL